MASRDQVIVIAFAGGFALALSTAAIVINGRVVADTVIVSAPLLSAFAAVVALWLATRSLAVQAAALRQQEWLHLLDARLQFRSRVYSYILDVKHRTSDQDKSHQRLHLSIEVATYLFGQEMGRAVEEAAEAVDDFRTLDTIWKQYCDEGDNETAGRFYEKRTEARVKLDRAHRQLELIEGRYLQRDPPP